MSLLHGHDVIFAIGAPAFTYHVAGQGSHVPDGARLFQLTDDPMTAAWTPVGMAAVGSIRLALLDLLARPVIGKRALPATRAPLPRVEPSSPMSVAYVLQTLHELRDPMSVVVEEAPTARPAMQAHLPILRSEGFYTTDSGGLGFAMPAAVGVALAKPGQRVIVLIGDGSALYSVQALWSAAQWTLPITFLILNNRRYAALLDFAPEFGFAATDSVQGTNLPGIDFVSIARGFGCAASRVEDASALSETLSLALRSTMPTVVEVSVK